MEAEFSRVNTLISGWPQFNVHFYDKMRKQNSRSAMSQLKNDCVLSVPRDIEGYLFKQQYDLSLFAHNASLGNATQSQQYVMDTVDAKFEKLRDSVYKLGLSMEQFRSMVEAQALFEWSPEVCLALCTRFCSWVVAEDEGEDTVS